jgi:cellulose synthase/poly-beta-1,6-N-acetylglucosamine synthase-like glycosyltransferase
MHADGQAGADMIGDTKLTCTVIVPTYNRAQYIGEAIRSLLAQTRKPDQIIVVNDGSTDDTLSVLDHYAGRIEIISKVNGGKATAINMAILARFCLRYLGHAESARSLGQEIRVCPQLTACPEED